MTTTRTPKQASTTPSSLPGPVPAPPAPGPAAGHVLEARDLSLGYDDRLVVDGLSLTIPQGRVTVIVGANACGKSTLLRGLARLLKPRGGSALLDGHDISRLPTREVATRWRCSTCSRTSTSARAARS